MNLYKAAFPFKIFWEIIYWKSLAIRLVSYWVFLLWETTGNSNLMHNLLAEELIHFGIACETSFALKIKICGSSPFLPFILLMLVIANSSRLIESWRKNNWIWQLLQSFVYIFNPLTANSSKWSTICLSVFDHFVGLALEELITSITFLSIIFLKFLGENDTFEYFEEVPMGILPEFEGKLVSKM